MRFSSTKAAPRLARLDKVEVEMIESRFDLQTSHHPLH